MIFLNITDHLKKENYLFDLFFQLYEWVFVRDSVMILYDVVG